MVVDRKSVEELRSRGVVKLRDKDMYALWMKTACGNMNSRQLRKLAEITEKYARGYLLFTTRQIPIIPFIQGNDVERVQEELKAVYLILDRCGPTVRGINVCYDDTVCPFAITSCLSLGEKLDNYFYAPMTHKVKIGVAGCSRDCIVSRVLTDIGFVAVEREGRVGYDAYVGGRLGVNPFLGVRMAELLDEEEAARFVQNFFDFMNREGKPGERAADLVKRFGAEKMERELNHGLHLTVALEPIKCETRSAKKSNDKIILKIRATCGEVTALQLTKIADIADRYGLGYVYFAVRGAPEIPGVDRASLEAIRRELDGVQMTILDAGVDNLQACFGEYCTEANVAPQSLLRQVEEMVADLGINDRNIKISASGCPNSCGIAHLNDIGFMGLVEPEVRAGKCNGCGLCLAVCKRKAIAMVDGVAVIDMEKCRDCGQCISVCPLSAIAEKRRGFAVLVGGRDGEDTRIGEIIARFLSEDEALSVADRALRLLQENHSDMAAIIDELGIDSVKKILVSGESQ